MARRIRRSIRKRRSTRRVSRVGRRLRGATAFVRGAYPTLPPITSRRRVVKRGARLGKRRRFASGSGTVTKRVRIGDSAGYTQWKRYGFNRKLARLTLRKTLRANAATADFVWRAVAPLRERGMLWMYNRVEAATHDQWSRPIYLVDLTSAYTQHGNVAPVHRLIRGTILENSLQIPAYIAQEVPGLSPTDIRSNAWDLGTEYGWQRAFETDPERLSEKSILKWSEIRLDLWGCKKAPVEFTLSLVQFDEKALPPHSLTDGITERQAVDWWDDLSTKLINNPNIRRPPNGEFNNLLKVIDRKTFTINPTATYESDVDPHCKTVRLFYRHNRLVNFVWKSGDPAGTNVDQVSTDPASTTRYNPQLSNDGMSTAEPKARVYLMITCANWSGTADWATAAPAVPTTEKDASFNLQVYNRWAC